MVHGREFYARDAARVAVDLLGSILTHRTNDGLTQGIIVETEAYLGQGDPSSHAFHGPTPRNAIMFGPAGYAYVYFTYGIHHCFNVITGSIGTAEAVLIRALEPCSGTRLMKLRRRRADTRHLCSGPAKLVQAMGITKADNGLDLASSPSLFIETGKQPLQIVATTRIGITKAVELPLRFYIKDNPYVSKLLKSKYNT